MFPRYNMTGLCNPLFWWDLSLISPELRYNMTSTGACVSWKKEAGGYWAPGPNPTGKPEHTKIMEKHPLDSKRLRRIPDQFSWVDHRLVRRRLLSGQGTPGWALYLFLVTVGDERGLSYYSDGSICGHLGIAPDTLGRARRSLLEGGLLAWRAPLYQVLDLAGTFAGPAKRSARAASARPVTEPAGLSAEEDQAGRLRLARMLSEIVEGGAQ